MSGIFVERGGIRYRWMGALLGVLGLRMAAASKTGIFEVDLLFPRNVTFAPGPLPPYVFAIHNPALASPLGAILRWTIWHYGGDHYGPTGSFNLYSLNDSVSNPYLVSGIMDQVCYNDSIWGFEWDVVYNNCSSDDAGVPTFFDPYNHTVFTTNSSAQTVDLVAETSAQTCSSRENYVFNVTATDYGVLGAQEAACAVLSQDSPPKPNPCAVQLSSDTVASIYASNSAVAAKSCYNLDQNTTYCSRFNSTWSPSTTATGSASAPSATAGLWLLMALTFSVLPLYIIISE